MPEQIPVIFRMPRDGSPVEAFLPSEPTLGGYVTCYAHVGQHGAAEYTYYRDRTRPAKPEEYADLLSELRGIYERDGDTLKVMRRMPPRRQPV